MSATEKVTADHLKRLAYLYIRQSTLHQMQNNRESTARQYDLRGRAQALGWNNDQIVVIDDDMGISGASAENRSGFQRLVAEVGLGRVGVVMGLEVSRLARSSADWHRLLEICALSETLILDEDGIYDPSHFNDRLLLGLKGTMSEAELHVLRARLIGGLLNKARRGELWLRPPIGFVYDIQKRFILDPDDQTRNAVHLLFETFHKEGSAERVVRHFSEQKILFPRRIAAGVRAAELIFTPMHHSRVLQILHNPRYAGAYVFGRTRQRKIIVVGQTRNRKLPKNEWKVFLPNICPGYITWEQFEANQSKLLENSHAYGHDRRRSPPREGMALLQGLVICGICGNRMTVRYHVNKDQTIPEYACRRKGIETAEPACQIIHGTGLDDAVAKIILDSVTPTSLDIALQVFEELQTRKNEIDRLRQAQVQRVKEEAEFAQRQYMLVRPENRLVADNLEREWNQKLLQLKQTEEEYARQTKQNGVQFNPEQKNQILSLASDLPKVWNDPRTPMREKKRMIRLLIEDVTLLRSHSIRIQIRWKGGTTTSFEKSLPKSWGDLVRTPTEIIEQIRELSTQKTDEQIVQILNGQSLYSGCGKSFNSHMMRGIRNRYKIKSFSQHLREAGWLTAPEVAAQLHIHSDTAKDLALEGILCAVRADDRGQILFDPDKPFPKVSPGKHFSGRRKYGKLPFKASTKKILKTIKEVQYAA